MKRTMGPVAAVVGILVVGANATRLADLFRWIGEQAPGALGALTARTAASSLQASGAAGSLDPRSGALLAVMALCATAFLFAVGGIGVELTRRGPRKAVLGMARRGRATAEIARRTQLSQDAVRTLLRPAREGTRLRA
jgi:hypothetical protein